jgi:hypothetical protein
MMKQMGQEFELEQFALVLEKLDLLQLLGFFLFN